MSFRTMTIEGVIQQLESSPPNRQAKIKFTVEAGLLVRGRLRRNLTAMGFFTGTHEPVVDFTEAKGLLDSTFYIKADGTADSLLYFLNRMKSMY